MHRVDVDTLHDLHLEARNIEELVTTGQVDREAGEHKIEDGETHQEEPNAVFVGFVEGSLGLDHAPEPQISGGLPRLFGVLVDTTHALVAHVQHQANDLRGLSEERTSLDHIVVVELGGGRILVELERSLDVAEVVVLVLEEARDHLGEMLLILLRARLV